MVRYAGGNVPDTSQRFAEPTITANDARTVARREFPRTFVSGGDSLVVFNPGLFMGQATPSHLAWVVEVLGRGVDGSKRVFVDAISGELIVGVSRNPTERNREVFSFRDTDFEDPAADAEQHYDESGPIAGVTPSADATSVYNNGGTVYDFFADELGRDSIDDAGMTMSFYVDLPEELMGGQNAYWNGIEQVMVYTPGLATLDITAHELTHGVVEFTAGLEYWMEAGALNESMADTFAAFIDEATPWTIGDSSAVGVIRSFSDPLSANNPHHTTLQYQPPIRGTCAEGCDPTFERCVGDSCMLNDGFSDAGGVHINSSIPNHIVYLFTEGGTHEVSGVSVMGIGRDRSIHLVYETLRRYLGAASTFVDYRVGARQTMLDFIEGAEWAPEGLEFTYEQCGAVLNAFASAGVGAEDRDNDCFDDEVDNCPCVYNPDQDEAACADMDNSCLENECEEDADCMEGTCGPAGRCVTFTPPSWMCTGPGQCPDGSHCHAGFSCDDPCGWRDCDTCILDTRCGWCPDAGSAGACIANDGMCEAGDFAPSCVDCGTLSDCGSCAAEERCGWCEGSETCEPIEGGMCAEELATECVDDSCSGEGSDVCLGCNRLPNCGWCEGVGCMPDSEADSCGGAWRASVSQCAPCDMYDDCSSCAADGFCAWCPGVGCLVDSDAAMMCSDPAINPGEC
ncbi:MAG: M4 family metallopeptidase [Myxococcota bacterium]